MYYSLQTIFFKLLSIFKAETEAKIKHQHQKQLLTANAENLNV